MAKRKTAATPKRDEWDPTPGWYAYVYHIRDDGSFDQQLVSVGPDPEYDSAASKLANGMFSACHEINDREFAASKGDA